MHGVGHDAGQIGVTSARQNDLAGHARGLERRRATIADIDESGCDIGWAAAVGEMQPRLDRARDALEGRAVRADEPEIRRAGIPR